MNNPKYGCILLGCIGNDGYGKKIVESLNLEGVHSLLEVSDGIESTRCGIAIYKKERCLLCQGRASTKLSTEFVIHNLEIINKANVLLIEGYFITKFDIIQILVKNFKNHNKTIAFTLSSTLTIQNSKDNLLKVCNESNLIFCNNEEAKIFSQCSDENIEKISESIHKLLKPLNRILIITCGKEPVIISKYNYKNEKIDFILKSFVYSIEENEIVDTNGCGDSFVGGFLSQYIQGESLEKCARIGNKASSVIIRNAGCTFPKDIFSI